MSSQHLTRVSSSSTPPRARLLLLFQVLGGDIEEKTMFLPVLVSSCAYCQGFFCLFVQQVFTRNLTHTTMTWAFCGQMDGMPPPGAHSPGLRESTVTMKTQGRAGWSRANEKGSPRWQGQIGTGTQVWHSAVVLVIDQPDSTLRLEATLFQGENTFILVFCKT